MWGTTKMMRDWSIAGLLIMSAAACAVGVGPAGVELAVRAPPHVRVEIRGPSPGPRYVWIDGHYAWRSGDYAWIGGAWTLPPEDSYHRWEPGHWAHARGGWYWVEGHWR